MFIFWAILAAGLILLNVVGLITASWWVIAAICVLPFALYGFIWLVLFCMFLWAFR